ncbi:MAG: DUF1934 domain-containing protein [Clostridiales bacterium]|jgi:uncharacterized beta-barrel protein YwiB (DUF1934 family)|nr:DUF1934 domain-containing protein [Clostridiales bacterium]
MKERQYPAKIVLNTYENGNQTLRINTDGAVTFRGQGVFIDFNSEDYQMTIGFSEDTITLTRIGEQSYTIILSKGKTEEFRLHTNYGIIPIKVTANEIELLDKDGVIDLTLDYSMKASLLTSVINYKLSLICTYGGTK